MSETPNSTTACRPSVLMSRRNVVTSCGRLCASSTATVPCSMPTGTVRLKSLRTSSGGAAVVRSKSWFSSPSRLSRIAPPTHQVSKPESSSFCAIFSTSGGIGRRSGNFIDCGLWIADCRICRPAPDPDDALRGSRCQFAIRNPQSAIGSPAQHTPAIDVQNLARYVPRQLGAERSEEHTSELQSHHELVCRLLLEK